MAFLLKINLKYFLKYSIDSFDALPFIQLFREDFLANPWLIAVTTNLLVLVTMTAFAFGFILLIDSNTERLYGDHCKYDNECAKNMNYVCQSGVCGCTLSTSFLSHNEGCGNVFV